MSVYDDGTDDGTNNQGGDGSDAGNDSEQTQEHNNDSDGGDEGSDAGNNNQRDQKTQEDRNSHRANPNGDDTDDEDDDSPPPMRKSKLQYIKERQERARQKREKQLENQNHSQKQQKDDADYEDEEDNENYDSLPDNERKMYDRFETMFLKKHGMKLDKASKAAEIAEENETNAEVTEFLKNHEYSDLVGKYEGKLRKFALHPSRKNVPINEILFGIAGEDLIAFGAELARKSMKEARQSRNGGGSNRKVEGDSGEKDYRKMPTDQFLEEQKKVLQGRK